MADGATSDGELVSDVDAGKVGLPRPLLEGLPAPYSGADWAHAEPHSGRMQACIAEALCAVCGVALDAAAVRYVGLSTSDIQEDGCAKQKLIDKGMQMDDRCARLSLAHCPSMREGRMVVVSVEPAMLELTHDHHDQPLLWQLRSPMPLTEIKARRLMLRTTQVDPLLGQRIPMPSLS